MSTLGDRVRKGPLILKGEKPKKKKKSKKHHHHQQHSEDDGLLSDGNAEDAPVEVPVRKCTGRIVCTNSTIQGMNTKFMEEIEQGDTILVHHPQSLQIEERQVVSVLSSRSLVVSDPFSQDFVTTTEFHVRKDGEVLRRKVEAKMKMKKEEIDEEGNTEGHGSVEDLIDKELQRKFKKKQQNLFTIGENRYVERHGAFGYKAHSEKVGKDVTKEDMLDMRVRKVHDKYC
ncbi:conserved hypothetical protein [Perkinsus marinus ATCC 50983]|uniref:Uncharacterized protein n=1 Tax=Perkinsus marinus (strain ATCC 50983 / TXsc) TaxID=423536 RepID=C5KLC2_PERM5|nr:conserved hypothetical protein [Perkinsus marinus ATCC 50983]EER14795.1 conserved hypothetical protein [Perkinsus marinus ATCC 50983]|eukprot:XP_002782999.1 conserved hypothetical protein [Perkinsus marinus ATCC 50983]